MATFQSQINILAAGQHQLHKRIHDITNLHLVAKYDSLDTFIFDNEDADSIKIEGLGYQPFDCILTVNSKDLHLMDYTGYCENLSSSINIPTTITKIITTNHNDGDSASISGTTLTLYSKTFNTESIDYEFPKIINLATKQGSDTSEPTTEGIKLGSDTGDTGDA